MTRRHIIVAMVSLIGAIAALFVLCPTQVQKVSPPQAPSPKVVVARAVKESQAETSASASKALAPVADGSEECGACVDRLVKAGGPTNMFLAYKAIQACVIARKFEVERAQETDPKGRAQFPDKSLVCRGITPTHIVSRIEYLKVAAQTGVHGAAMAFIGEGPTGTGVKDSIDYNEAASAEWNRLTLVYIDKGAEMGDRASLIAKSSQYENGVPGQIGIPNIEPDPTKALAYWVAANEMLRLQTGKDSAQGQNVTKRLSGALPPDQVEKAINIGKQLVDNFKTVQGY